MRVLETNLRPRSRWLAACVPLMPLVTMLGGCGGGAETVELPVAAAVTETATYNGPPPATDDVQSFKINLWDNVEDASRCGSCHYEGAQTPAFARRDDINLAYADVNGIVDLVSPGDSRMVVKVAAGHNCWLDSPDACADILSTWIGGWGGAVAGDGERVIELTAPPLKDAGASKSFPDDSGLFAATVQPLLNTYCSGCHAGGAPIPQSPFFAEADPDAAYAAARSRIDLDEPARSRLVLRLRDEFHNCWSNCGEDSQAMESAILAFADQIEATVPDAQLVISKALTLYDGVVASGGSRYEANVIATWEFKTGSGSVAYDTSGVDPAMDLTLSPDVAWVGGWGIELRGGKAQATTASSRKLRDLIVATGEYSIEAWVVPANVTQEEARIVSYSAGTQARNFTLGQTLYNYDFLNRATQTDANGGPALSTPDADERLQATLQHVVMTFDPVAGRRIYVNGMAAAEPDSGGGLLSDWDDTYALVLGNEVSSDRPFLGNLRMVAIHNRTLSEAQILQNFDAGVGERFFLLFAVGDIVQMDDAYIVMEVSQFDSYSYLFSAARFVVLGGNAIPGDIPLTGMRVGINGAEAPVGQVWSTLDTRLNDASYGPEGQSLSRLGTIIALEKGAAADEFFLTFDRLGDSTFVRLEPQALAPVVPADGTPRAQIGLRTFDEINATMAAVSNVNPRATEVRGTYEAIRQQLPTVETIEGFLASHQIAVAQLAIEYCNEWMDDPALRAGAFPAFDFAAPAATAFSGAAQRAALIDPLLERVAGAGLASQPDPAAVSAELDGLIDRLTACGGSCSAERTGTTAKAVCAAVLGSAVMLLQ